MKIIEREIVNSIIKQYAGKKVIKVLAGIRIFHSKTDTR